MPQRGEARFERLYESHRRALRAYALRRAEPEAAGDVVAETFLVAWRRLDEVPEDALPWLFGVARRVLANERRSTARRAALVDRLSGVGEPAQPAPGEALGEALALRAALRRLSERDRETLMLVAWEGLEPARAATAAGCSRAGFAVRLHRARRRLAAELELEEHPTDTPRAADPSTRAAAPPSDQTWERR